MGCVETEICYCKRVSRGGEKGRMAVREGVVGGHGGGCEGCRQGKGV
jgi:hypothetical protein